MAPEALVVSNRPFNILDSNANSTLFYKCHKGGAEVKFFLFFY